MDNDRAARAIDDFLRALGRDPAREPELLGTGARVADAFRELTSGYDVDVPALLRDNLIAQGGGIVTAIPPGNRVGPRGWIAWPATYTIEF